MSSDTKTSKVYNRIITSAKANDRRVHIISRPHGWAVKKEGNKAPTAILPTQNDAIKYARNLVSTGKASQIIIHRRDGQIRK